MRLSHFPAQSHRRGPVPTHAHAAKKSDYFHAGLTQFSHADSSTLDIRFKSTLISVPERKAIKLFLVGDEEEGGPPSLLHGCVTLYFGYRVEALHIPSPRG